MNTGLNKLRKAILGTVFLPLGVMAGPIYHWVDDNGVHHYTESAPPGKTDGISMVEVEDTRSPDYQPGQDIYGVEHQAERMQAMRDEMAEKREKYREDQDRRAQQQPLVVYQDSGYPFSSSAWWGNPGYPSYPNRPGKPPGKPPGRPPGKPPLKPGPPIEPPLKPGPPPSYPFDPPGNRR